MQREGRGACDGSELCRVIVVVIFILMQIHKCKQKRYGDGLLVPCRLGGTAGD